jgi:Tol biopolymer transport system component
LDSARPDSTLTADRTSAAERSASAATDLSAELHNHGWLVFSAKTKAGDWDLFLMRPDGSDRKRLTHTPKFNETGARFSPEGTRLLYFRQPMNEPVDNNTYGTFDLILAEADGQNPVELGRHYPWATWGADDRQLACLKPTGIQIVDLKTRSVRRRLPRRGIVQQLVWSRNGRQFAGTANGLGPFWNIGCLNADTGEIHPVSETDRYNCTPDWYPDSQQVLYSRGIIPEKGGKAELWLASASGKQQRLLYAETDRHVYGACASPDGNYLLFTRSAEDLGKVDHSQTTMSIIRWRDAPVIGDESPALQRRVPEASQGPRLDLGPGWEPHWTSKDISK